VDRRKLIRGSVEFFSSREFFRQKICRSRLLFYVKSKNLELMLEMLDGQAVDAIDKPESLLAAFGSISIALQSLSLELAQPDSEQDAEKLFQLLVVISSTAMLAAAEHVLPVLESEA